MILSNGKLLNRYVTLTVAGAMMVVLFIVLALDLVFAFIAETDDLKNSYQFPQALEFMLLTVPRRIYDYLPLAAFIGSLVGLGTLANSSELTVMRSAGVSIARLIWMAMKPALVVVVAGLLIGEYVAPYTEQRAQTQKAVQQGASDNLASSSGVWHREGESYMHFNAVQLDGTLYGVSLFELDVNNRLQSASFARRAVYDSGNWQLLEVSTTSFEGSRTSSRFEQSRDWQTGLTPGVLKVLIVKPEYLSIKGLYTYMNYLRAQALDASEYAMAFWKKVLQPAATAVLVLIAISFIFGPLRSVTMGFRVFCGIIVGLLFKYAQDLLGPASLVFGFNPIIATLTPIIVSAVIGIVLLRRVR
ncbi:LPS export ABC transporter permease LptG [Allohahella sp. A8]|mgnify:CR=1 FL=1|uniref:LPS export ABC transporter permease LptG n=1 Tax=Allohahella sp. A8 TaxID=3141461 RepID=UPI000C0B2268|nr:LPS export ABC transporter permease LptG [Hahellaceae bacterium]|tara:strand:- start:50997 stop:52073 length:1077 start_codon:yes stop_codon:yes gene_type:complete